MSEDRELTGYEKERAEKLRQIEDAAALVPEDSVFEVPSPPANVDGEPEWAPPEQNVPDTDNGTTTVDPDADTDPDGGVDY